MSSNNPSNKNRLYWVDYTKGLSILGILLFHFFQNYPKEINLISILDRTGAKVGYAAVDIFFVMAGFTTSYVLLLKNQKSNLNRLEINWKDWLLKRINRIYPGYILAVTLSLLLYYFFGNKNIQLNFNLLLSIIGLAGYKFQEINPGFWFFTVILEAYLVIPLIFIICNSQPAKILWLGIFGGVITKIACVLVDNSSQVYWYLLQNNFLGSYFFQLCLGLYWGIIFLKKSTFRKIDYTIATGVFATGLVVYLLMGWQKIDIIYMEGFDILFTPFFFIACYLIFELLSKQQKKIDYILRLLSLLGIYSYQIYLIHQPLYFVLFRPLTKGLDVEPYLKVIIVMIITMVLLTVYLFVFIFLENFFRKLVVERKN